MQENNNASVRLKEEYVALLLKTLYDKQSLQVYDYAANEFTTANERFTEIKQLADLLVKEKLADYKDEERTTLSITNFGRYWIMKGGYEIFLKEAHSTKEHGAAERRHSKEELLEARLKLTHFRLVGFWFTLIISLIGFLLSLFNLYMFLTARN